MERLVVLNIEESLDLRALIHNCLNGNVVIIVVLEKSIYIYMQRFRHKIIWVCIIDISKIWNHLRSFLPAAQLVVDSAVGPDNRISSPLKYDCLIWICISMCWLSPLRWCWNYDELLEWPGSPQLSHRRLMFNASCTQVLQRPASKPGLLHFCLFQNNSNPTGFNHSITSQAYKEWSPSTEISYKLHFK